MGDQGIRTAFLEEETSQFKGQKCVKGVVVVSPSPGSSSFTWLHGVPRALQVRSLRHGCCLGLMAHSESP